MAQMSDLFPELYTIITFLVISSGDIRDWPTVSATCRKFKDVATKPNILRAVKFQDLIEIGHPEQHLHINGLLNRGVQAGNMNAEYTMAKTREIQNLVLKSMEVRVLFKAEYGECSLNEQFKIASWRAL
ncbi:hypothetical protein Tco_0012741 [Tanacetum coccineum]